MWVEHCTFSFDNEYLVDLRNIVISMKIKNIYSTKKAVVLDSWIKLFKSSRYVIWFIVHVVANNVILDRKQTLITALCLLYSTFIANFPRMVWIRNE